MTGQKDDKMREYALKVRQYILKRLSSATKNEDMSFGGQPSGKRDESESVLEVL